MRILLKSKEKTTKTIKKTNKRTRAKTLLLVGEGKGGVARHSPTCIVVRRGWQCVRHADSARGWRRRRLALDGGLVFPTIFVHRRYLELNEWTLADGSGGDFVTFGVDGRVGTFLLCFLRSLG